MKPFSVVPGSRLTYNFGIISTLEWIVFTMVRHIIKVLPRQTVFWATLFEKYAICLNANLLNLSPQAAPCRDFCSFQMITRINFVCMYIRESSE